MTTTPLTPQQFQDALDTLKSGGIMAMNKEIHWQCVLNALQQCAKGCGEIDDVYIPSHRSYRDIDSILTSFELEQRANEELAVIKSIRRVLLMPVNPLHRTQKGD